MSAIENSVMPADRPDSMALNSQFRLIDLLFLIGGVGVALGFSRWLLGRWPSGSSAIAYFFTTVFVVLLSLAPLLMSAQLVRRRRAMPTAGEGMWLGVAGAWGMIVLLQVPYAVYVAFLVHGLCAIVSFAHWTLADRRQPWTDTLGATACVASFAIVVGMFAWAMQTM